MLRYIGLKTGYQDDGPAWVGRVKQSRSRRTVYFNGRALHQVGRGRHVDIVTREEFWVSGVKKDGEDRHWTGSGLVYIEESAVTEYLAVVGERELDVKRFRVIGDLPEPNPSEFVALENQKLAR
jgi:hypothetical protein